MGKFATIKARKEIYARYKKFCKQNGFLIGKRVENFMREDLENPLNFVRKIKRVI